jgi:SAM-dependent methyltransferase
MEEEDILRINSRYNKRLDTEGFSIAGLASGSESRRAIRFEVLRNVGIKSGARILDVGCGLADFKRYLDENGVVVDYFGVDINPRLINECRRIYPKSNFCVADIERESLGQFDFVVSSSVYNLRLINTSNYDLIESVMSAMYRHATEGVAIDMLSSWVDFKGNPVDAFYYEPADVFNRAKRITKRVQLRHDYPLFEFCIYLYPDFEGWGSATS